MKTRLTTSQEDFENVTQFFGTMWKEEFDLDRFDRIEEYKNGIVIIIEDKQQIIGAISVARYKGEWLVGRFGVLESYRKKGLGKQLFAAMEKEIQNRGIKKISLFAEINRTSMYENFGFKQIGEPKNIGNTQSIKMEKHY